MRILAFEALRAVDERDAYANLVLPPAAEEGPREGRLRRRGTRRSPPSWSTGRCAARARTTRSSRRASTGRCARSTRRCSTCSRSARTSCSGTRIPTHAAVSASVELARVVLGDGRAKFVNAVLRKIAAARPRRLAGAGRPAVRRGRRGPPRRRALASAVDRLRAVGRAGRRPRRDRGPAGGRQRAARGDARRPARPLHHRRAARRAGRGVRRCPAAGRRTPCGWPRAASPAPSRPYGTGGAGVQDEGSQLVAIALANAPLDGPDARWLDGCAGPGGKAALLAALAAERGASLLASEKQPHRARLVERALAGNPGPYQVIAADGTRPPWRAGLLRPGARRRPVHGPRRAAPPSRGPLAAAPRGPGGLRAAPTRAAARGVEGRTGRGSGRLRDLLAAPRRDPGGRGRRPQGPRRRGRRGRVGGRPAR